MRIRLAPLFALLASACGQPDNQMLGGVLAAGGSNVPNALLPDVNSSISSVVQIKDQNGKTAHYAMVVMSDRHDLCTSLQHHSDYFKNPPEGFVAMVMTGKAEPLSLGSFLVGASNGGNGALIATAGPGFPNQSYPAAQGTLSLRQFDPGGQAQGSFDLIVVDVNGGGHEVFGRFKTQPCAALDGQF